jgi:hypothetical protein
MDGKARRCANGESDVQGHILETAGVSMRLEVEADLRRR